MQQTCLVSTINKNYLIAFKVFLSSLISYNKHLSLDYIVYIEDDITEDDQNKLKQIYPNLLFLAIDKNEYKKYSFSGDREWDFNPAFRLEIFKLEYDKVIYFDVDAICLKPIDEILNIDYSFAGIEHELHDIDQIKSQYSFKGSRGVNGGFLIIKKEFLNEHTINGIACIFNTSRWYGNQGPINIFFRDKAALLDKKYFLPTTHANLSSIKDAFFIHFLGEKKPWYDGQISDKYSSQVLKFIDTPTVVKIQNLYDSYLNDIK